MGIYSDAVARGTVDLSPPEPEPRIVLVEVKSVYGVATVYPKNRNATLIAEIAGTKALTIAALTRAEALGFEIVSMADADWRNAGKGR